MCTGFELPLLFSGAEAAGAATLGAEALAGGSLLGGEALVGGGLLTGATAAGEGALGLLAGGTAAGAGLGAGLDLGASWGADALGTLGSGWGGSALDTFGALGTGSSSSAFGGLGKAFGAAAKYASPISSAYSGITGIMRAEEMRKMAKLAALKGDPWGNSGGRGLADAQLQDLLRDPSAVAATDPAYRLRIQGAQRANAQYGQDSGRMSIAGADASTSWYNERLAQLGGLAGAGVTPGNGGATGIQGLSGAADLESSALGSFGYGLAGGGMNRGGMTPTQQQKLIQLALGG